MSEDAGITSTLAVWAQSLFRPVRESNAFEATVERLAQAMKLGVVPAGGKLPPERELADLLGVSRTTLREALRALSDAGFVTVRRGRGGGTFVIYRAGSTPGVGSAVTRRRPLGDRLTQILDFRRVLEPGAAALAASRTLSAADRDYLSACLDECDAAPLDGAHRVADSRLHLAIAGVTGCSPLVTAVADVQMDMGELLAEIPVLRANITHSSAQHRRIVTAVLAGDDVAARESMEEHCDATSALLRGLLG